MNAASMSAGMGLVTRHSLLADREYTAVVRLRADIGSRKIRIAGSFDQFLNDEGWRRVRRTAEMLERRRRGRSRRERRLLRRSATASALFLW